jgi:LDH2 family malate/lactate/ureidoglycolate dehydrogenase
MLLASTGMPEDQAEIIADCLVEADLRGVASHGVMRLPIYLPRLQGGAMNPKPQVRIQRRQAVGALVDGDNGLGHLVSSHAARLVIEIAQASGMAVVSAINSNHFGAAGIYSSKIAEAGLVGISLSNTCPALPAMGGKAPVVGNGPVSFALPASDGDPVCLDISTSAGAYGKILLAAKAGHPIPEGWAVDLNGEATTDPNVAIASQLLLPFAGHKGFGISFLIDALCAAFGNSHFGVDVPNIYLAGEEMKPGRNSHLFIAIRSDLFCEASEFLATVDSAKRQVQESPKAKDVGRVYYPGEKEWITRRKQLQDGIGMPASVARELEALSSSRDVKAPWL